MATNTKQERTTLDADTIAAGANIFGPNAGDVAARVLWILDVMDSTGSNATQVASDVDAYYALKGVRNPRGYGRASLVNSATTGKLWDETGLGQTKGKYTTEDGTAQGTHVTLIDRLDSARNAHGKKTVSNLIRATLESLSEDVKPGVKFGAVMDALGALLETPVQSSTPDPTPKTIADVINLLKKAHDLAEELDLSEMVCGSISDAIEVTGREVQND